MNDFSQLVGRRSALPIGIELSPARVAGAADLTQRVNLGDKVKVIEGDVTTLPLASGSQDAAMSQEEGLAHVPDLALAFSEAYRVLRPGGRIAFTNLAVHQPLSDAKTRLGCRDAHQYRSPG
jgi:sarcosine/dimethylglycine N-methyltransferase